jgi:hypothetical protein
MLFQILLLIQVLNLIRDGLGHKTPMNLINIYLLINLETNIFIYFKLYQFGQYLTNNYYMYNVFFNFDRYSIKIDHWLYNDCKTIINYIVENIYKVFWINLDELILILDNEMLCNSSNSNRRFENVFKLKTFNNENKFNSIVEDIMNKDFELNDTSDLDEVLEKLQKDIISNNNYLEIANEIRRSMGKEELDQEKFNQTFSYVKNNYLNYYE